MHGHINATATKEYSPPLINIQFCEGKYGGLAMGGAEPLGVHLPEHLNSWSGIFIAWCGLHMLLFNQHDDLTLKLVAALFCLNGAASFLYHWTGYDSALAIDGYLMMNAVWLTTGFVLENLTSHMVDGPAPWDGMCHKGFIMRRIIRTIYWVAVTCVPALFLLALERPWRAYVGNISPWFLGAFIAPLVLMLVVNVVLMLSGAHARAGRTRSPPRNQPWLRDALPGSPSGRALRPSCRLPTAFILTCTRTRPRVATTHLLAAIEDAGFEHYPSFEAGLRTFSAARSRFFWGLTLVLLGVGAWLLSEGLCDQFDAFKVFPGHALFHVLMALGLTNCIIYPATLRARTYGAHVKLLIDSPLLHDVPSLSPPLRVLRLVGRVIALTYFFIFPAMRFVRSATLVTSSSGDRADVEHDDEQQEGGDPAAAIPPVPQTPSYGIPWSHPQSAARATPERKSPAQPPSTPESRRLEALEARMIMLERQGTSPQSLHEPAQASTPPVSPLESAHRQGRGARLPPPSQQQVHQAV